MALVCQLLFVNSASAYNTLGCKWGAVSISYYNAGSNSTWTSVITAGANSWSSSGISPAELNGKSASVANFYALNENRGNVSWSGVFRRAGTVDSNPVGSSVSCQSGKWVSQEVELVINTYYLSGYPTSWRTGVAAHEFGHAFGLAHNNAVGQSCAYEPDKPSRALFLMYYSDDRFVSRCATIFGPKSDDVAGVNALY